MKVRINFTVDIDARVWEGEFGTPTEEIRSDVKQYAQRLAIEALDSQGLLT